MFKFRFPLVALIAASVVASGFAQSPGQGQGPGRGVAPVQTAPSIPFRATNYEIRASLDAVGRALTAQAKVDFLANEPGRIVDVELSQMLRVNGVRDAAGKPLTYDRDENTPLKLRVTLPESVPAGGKVTLQFDYAGPLSTRSTTAEQGVQLAHIDKDGGYLLLPARWFATRVFSNSKYPET
jgi:hypothetical protein